MSKFNILEFNKTMRTHLKGAVEGAAQKEEKARQRLREAQQLEADVMRRLEEKKLREQAAEVEMPAAPAEAPTAAVHEQSTPAPASVPQPEDGRYLRLCPLHRKRRPPRRRCLWKKNRKPNKMGKASLQNRPEKRKKA